ncbi:MAG: glycosyltransferase N-terminal domain-containing protein [Bacteroidota bacterium]
MRLIYNIGIRLYQLVAIIISPWNPKAKKWVKGRNGWYKKLQNAFEPGDRVVWFHCASLGEFEQGRPVIEAMKERCPEYKILLSFFSPSGYEKRKDYEEADHVMYLPLDTARNAKRLVTSVSPEMVLFVKYEFWFHFLSRIKKEGIPVYLISGIFRPGQIFFKWYGRWYRRFLDAFTHIFVQQEASRRLLEESGFDRVSVSGDTRFDRVKQLVQSEYSNPALEAFTSEAQVLVAGSTWEPDEQILEEAYKELPSSLLWIIAPHELSNSHLEKLQKRFPESVLFTETGKKIPPDTRVVIVNTIGHLSHLYRYGTLAYIGGGFGKGIHNILEAATYGLPVFFGPNYRKFSEAIELSERGAAFPVSGTRELLSTIHQQLGNSQLLKTTSGIASNYVIQRVGATSRILEKLCKK